MKRFLYLALAAVALLCANFSAMAMEPWDVEAHEAELARVREMIKANGYTWTAGETAVSVLSPEERAPLFNGLIVPDDYVEPEEQAGVNLLDFPAVFDWRTMGGVSPVKNQGNCGSCWAFCVVAAFESAIMINDQVTLDLSEQQLVSCNNMGYGCNGGWLDAANMLINPGSIAESCQPYTASDSTPCRQSQCSVVAQLDDWNYTNSSINSIKTALQTGPVACAVYAYNDLSYYSGGCYEGPTTSSVNHGVTIVGWNDNVCPNGSWIVKNSWGPNWGDGGFFYIEYGNCNIGYSPQVYEYAPTSTVVLSLANYQVIDDSGDGVLDPGEAATVTVTLRNSGSATATGVTGNLGTWNGNVSINDGLATWANIGAGATGTSQSPHFRITIGSGAIEGSEIQFFIVMRANEGTWNSSFTIPIGESEETEFYYTGFETGDDGWTHVQVATQDDWQRGTPSGNNSHDPASAYAGTKIFGNDLAGSGWDGNYKNSVNNYLLSPAINCSGRTGVRLQFMRWLTVERGQYDQATIYVNNTQVWTNPVSADLVDTSWVPVDLDISAIADNNASVRIKFELVSDGGVVFGGWNIDEVKLIAGGGGSNPTPTPTVPPSTPTATPQPTVTPTPGGCTVTITNAVYFGAYRSLRVNATCSQQPGAALTVWANGTTYLGPMLFNLATNVYGFRGTVTSPPDFVEVRSNCGGSSTRDL